MLLIVLFILCISVEFGLKSFTLLIYTGDMKLLSLGFDSESSSDVADGWNVAYNRLVAECDESIRTLLIASGDNKVIRLRDLYFPGCSFGAYVVN